jgi:hypothetical protein
MPSRNSLKPVIRLKEQIEKHRTYCYAKDTNTDSSISSLGLDQFDGNDVSDSDSDNKTVQTKENSISPTIPYQDYHNTSSNTIMQTADTSPELPGTNTEMMDTSQSLPIQSSLQTADAAPLISAPVNNSCSNADIWETPPQEFFQEWRETASKHPNPKPLTTIIKSHPRTPMTSLTPKCPSDKTIHKPIRHPPGTSSNSSTSGKYNRPLHHNLLPPPPHHQHLNTRLQPQQMFSIPQPNRTPKCLN